MKKLNIIREGFYSNTKAGFEDTDIFKKLEELKIDTKKVTMSAGGVSYKGNLKLSLGPSQIIPIKFDIIEGDFILLNCAIIRDLENSPTKVTGNYNILNCKNLVTLDGIAQYIGGSLNITGCRNLSEIIDISNCNVGGDITITNASFEFMRFPKNFKTSSTGDVIIVNNKKLKSFQWFPERINGTLNVSGCSDLLSREDLSPAVAFGYLKYVKNNFECRDCSKFLIAANIKSAGIKVGGKIITK